MSNSASTWIPESRNALTKCGIVVIGRDAMDIWTAVVSYIVGLATLATPLGVSKFIRWRTTTRPFGRFWSPMMAGGLSIITAGEEREPVTKSQVFDFLAVNDATTRFRKFLGQEMVPFPCDATSTECLSRNLLSIGGPISNDISKELMKFPGIRYVFRINDSPELLGEVEGNDIVDRSDPGFLLRPEFEDSAVRQDWAIITKCANPFHSGREAIVVAGCYGWGTWAAVEALLNPKNLALLLARRAHYFQILTSVRVFRRLPQEPRLEESTFITIGE